ncbi:hypothetical protein CHLNCDRAFT_135224 [Chlorella variabilis]|uniref:BZIP domain-containing protein n=1 Tax=Chlorella variabilis TaxID=554065 RepID=E1ZHS0_CHLVA|nr:hypothetical protein CHLNCDRAFT_135224 [Chlorella variabilis]EFN54510.1 hypothetical protein CHLNCDRAFT_135224 [Chlorella variabilis]|eukprot:XP_005846612.1 hypothetical protein CHLNCDRAFT_135224 [Chlorella variabilis]
MINVSGHNANSLIELEGLLSMDGTPHERVPVDDYFSHYLEGLSSLAAQKAVPANTGRSDSACLSNSCTPPVSGSEAPACSMMIAAGSLPSSVQMQPMPPQVATAAGGAAPWALPLMPGMMMMQPGGPTVAAMPLIPLLGGMPMMAVGKQQQPAAGKNGISGRQHQRQATNREAQKRYRERQKARLLEMQVAIDSLTRQLAQHQKVQSQNLKLEEQHYRLQAQLARIENEAEALQWQRQQQQHEARQLCRNGRCRAASPEAAVAVDESSREGRQQAEGAPQQPAEQARQDSSVAGSAVGERHDSAGSLPTDSDAVFGSAEAAAATAGQHNGSATEQLAAAAAAAAAEALGEPTVGMYGEPPPHEAFDDLLARFQAQVNKVKDFLAEQRLCNHNPSALVLSTATRGQLFALMQESLGICRDLLRVEGVEVINMLVANEETMGVAAEPGSHVRRKWLHVIQVLQLTPEQKQQLMLQRSAHLALMRRIYQQRQQLNMQAMSLMLLGPSSMMPSSDSAAAGTGNAVVRAASSAQAAKLAGVLNLVKENLRREQRAAMEINSW